MSVFSTLFHDRIEHLVSYIHKHRHIIKQRLNKTSRLILYHLHCSGLLSRASARPLTLSSLLTKHLTDTFTFKQRINSTCLPHKRKPCRDEEKYGSAEWKRYDKRRRGEFPLHLKFCRPKELRGSGCSAEGKGVAVGARMGGGKSQGVHPTTSYASLTLAHSLSHTKVLLAF